MAGLLDFISTPEGQGLLSATFGGLAGARRGQPINSIGRAGMAGLMGYGNAQERIDTQKQNATTQEMARIALDKARRDNQNEQGLLGLQSQFFQPGSPGSAGTADVNGALPPEMQTGATLPATPAKPPQFDVQGYTQAALSKGLMGPAQAMALQASMAKDSTINKLDVKDFTPASVAKYAMTKNYADLVRMDKLHFADTGGAIAGLDPFTGQPRAAAPKTGNPFSDLVVADGKGGFTPNSPLVGVKQGLAKAGATNIRVENKMGEGLAAQVGPMMVNSVAAAEGAAKQIDAANRIISAVDSNKMFSGTGAELRLTAAQLSDTLGIGGGTNAEKIANTRQALQGLSQLTLQGRAQMRGQGAITESESKLAERATSGDITMTPVEIKQLASAAKRAASYMQAEHGRKLEVIKANPNLSSMAPFYDVVPVPAQTEPAAAVKPQWRYVNGKLQKVE